MRALPGLLWIDRLPVLPRPALPGLQVCLGKLWAQVGRHFDPPKSMTNLR
jgi:hypothetical protein